MSKIDQLFERLRREQRKAFMPFVTAGDPNLDFTCAAIREFVRRGSSLCEIGIPYSDPIADGPVIQASYSRALQQGIRLNDILTALATVSGEVEAPLVTMVSYAIVLRCGPEAYVARAATAGIAGLIVPDLPVEEAAALSRICRASDLDLIQLVTPTTHPDRALRIAETSTGFLYYVSVTGITGERTQLPQELVDNVGQLRQRVSLPICIGFGISHPDHVRRLASVADGLIVGSAIVKRIATTQTHGHDEVLSDVGKYVAEMVAALNAC